MDTYSSNLIDPANLPPQKNSGPWLWISIALGLLIICALLIVLAFMLNPDLAESIRTFGSNVKVTAGTYDGTTYTAPHDNFTCDFGTLMSSPGHPILADGEHEKEGTGVVFLMDPAGNQYGIDYFRISNGGDELSKALHSTYKQDIYREILDTLIMPAHGETASLVHTEIISNTFLFAVISNPDGSFQQGQGTNVEGGLDEGYYIFNREEWIYIVYAYGTPAHKANEINWGVVKKEVNKIYNQCQFVR